MTQCILLNADYSFLNIVHWKRAVCLVAKQKVEVISYSKKIIKGAEGYVMRLPSVMRLIKLIRTIYRTKVPFSKKNILVRDGHRCAYCGKAAGHLTIDHIIPRSRGGKSDFDNCVACCPACNTAKGCRTPREAGFFLKKRPYQPTISEFLRMRLSKLGLDGFLEELNL